MSVSGSDQPGSLPQTSLRGGIDLSALKARATAPQRAESTTGRGPAAIEVDERTFPELVRLSETVPVVTLLWAAYSPESQRALAELETVVASYGGRFAFATADVEAFPQLAQAMQVQAVPTAVAFLKGQPVPLFQGVAVEEQLRQLLDELLRVAEANGVAGTVPVEAGPEGTVPAEPEVPPLHQEAFEAIERGDYPAAEAAYRQALAERPADHEAKAGLAQVQLMARVADLSQPEADRLRGEAAQDPANAEAQLAVADLDLSGGHVEDAFARLIALISRVFGEEREPIRVRLLELFEIVGTSDPRVSSARQALARVLF